jgi:hypothetical protein
VLGAQQGKIRRPRDIGGQQAAAIVMVTFQDALPPASISGFPGQLFQPRRRQGCSRPQLKNVDDHLLLLRAEDREEELGGIEQRPSETIGEHMGCREKMTQQADTSPAVIPEGVPEQGSN